MFSQSNHIIYKKRARLANYIDKFKSRCVLKNFKHVSARRRHDTLWTKQLRQRCASSGHSENPVQLRKQSELATLNRYRFLEAEQQ